MKCKYLLQDDIGAEKWGWEKRTDKFFPIMTDLKSAPENLINCISCKCKMVKKKVHVLPNIAHVLNMGFPVQMHVNIAVVKCVIIH